MSFTPVTAPPRPGPQVNNAVVAWVVIGLLILTVIGVFCSGLWVYANHDRPGLIDNPEVSEPVEDACTTMEAAVAAKAAPRGAAREVVVRSIREQNAAVSAMVAQVRALDDDLLRDDSPTIRWLADWETLVAARERYAEDLAAGREPRFVVPAVEGSPIVDRLNSVGLACEVPPQLVDLD